MSASLTLLPSGIFNGVVQQHGIYRISHAACILLLNAVLIRRRNRRSHSCGTDPAWRAWFPLKGSSPARLINQARRASCQVLSTSAPKRRAIWHLSLESVCSCVPDGFFDDCQHSAAICLFSAYAFLHGFFYGILVLY